VYLRPFSTIIKIEALGIGRASLATKDGA